MKIEAYRRLTLSGWRWYWRARARNGRIVADGAEGYRNRIDLIRSISLIQRELALAELVGLGADRPAALWPKSERGAG